MRPHFSDPCAQFTSNGSRAHRFVPTTVNMFITTVIAQCMQDESKFCSQKMSACKKRMS
jgi:hypothetical protein